MRTVYALSEILARRSEYLSSDGQKVILLADNGDVPNQTFAWTNCLPYILSSCKIRAFLHEMQGFMSFIQISQMGDKASSRFESSESVQLRLGLIAISDEMRKILDYAGKTEQLKMSQDSIRLPMSALISYERGLRELMNEKLDRRKEIKNALEGRSKSSQVITHFSRGVT